MRKQIVLLLASVAGCQAGKIVEAVYYSGPITLGCSACTLNSPIVNNGPTPVWNTPDYFSFALTVNGFGAYADPIIVTLTGGVTEYDVTITVTNGTSLPIVGWTFGVPGVPYDFDYPSFDGPDTDTLGWGVALHTDSTLKFEAGLLPQLLPGGTMSFTMAIDVPDCTLALPACNFIGNPQFGSAGAQSPEPGTMALLAAPLLALLIYSRRKMLGQQ
jgi:hypothetical protein